MKTFEILLNITKSPSKASGFTMIELLITIGIAGILLAAAVPTMQEFVRKNRLEGESQRLVGLLAQARNQALTSGRPSFVCRTTSAELVQGGDAGDERFACSIDGMGVLDWAQEMLVYTQLPNSITSAPNNRFRNQRIDVLVPDGDGAADRRQMVVTVSEAPNLNLVVTANRNDFVIRFNPDGTLANNAPFRIAVCDNDNDAPERYGRIIEIGAAGQIRSSQIETDDTDRDCTPTTQI